MTEKEIFEELFSIVNESDDTQGVVSAGLVREGKILYKAVSMSGSIHAEYALLEKLKDNKISININDIVYTTVEPCGKRTPGGRGEKMGDCTTNLINVGVKKIIYAAKDPDASDDTRHKFQSADVSCIQTTDEQVTRKAVEIFNSTCADPTHWLPLN